MALVPVCDVFGVAVRKKGGRVIFQSMQLLMWDGSLLLSSLGAGMVKYNKESLRTASSQPTTWNP